MKPDNLSKLKSLMKRHTPEQKAAFREKLNAMAKERNAVMKAQREQEEKKLLAAQEAKKSAPTPKKLTTKKDK